MNASYNRQVFKHSILNSKLPNYNNSNNNGFKKDGYNR